MPRYDLLLVPLRGRFLGGLIWCAAAKIQNRKFSFHSKTMVGKTATSLPCAATPWYRRRGERRRRASVELVEEGSARQDGCAGRAGMKWRKFPNDSGNSCALLARVPELGSPRIVLVTRFRSACKPMGRFRNVSHRKPLMDRSFAFHAGIAIRLEIRRGCNLPSLALKIPRGRAMFGR